VLAVLCYAMPCRGAPCRAVMCRDMPCRAVLCRAVPCYAVLCRAVPERNFHSTRSIDPSLRSIASKPSLPVIAEQGPVRDPPFGEQR